MSEYTLFIDDWHPARLNQLMRGHWSNGHRAKKADLAIICGYAVQAKIPVATGKRSVELTITLGPRQRAADPDAYFKSACDALVRCRLLTDDNRQGVELLPVKFERGEKKATRIVLREIA